MNTGNTDLGMGFLLSETNKDLTFYTLRLALKSYFSTYQVMRVNFNT